MGTLEVEDNNKEEDLVEEEAKLYAIIVGNCCAPAQQPLKNIISSNKILFCFDEMFDFHIANLKNEQLLK